MGPLDQGFWPDGLYTAPTDEALRYDIEMTKKLGMNMARKHVKMEPERWYYWCDKLGLLVWQDMPSGDKYIGSRDPDITRTPESGQQFETEFERWLTAAAIIRRLSCGFHSTKAGANGTQLGSLTWSSAGTRHAWSTTPAVGPTAESVMSTISMLIPGPGRPAH